MTDPTLIATGSCAGIARRADPDRFLCALFAPSDRREALFVLIAFHHELVRAVRLPSARSGAGPIATLIRLQWWREVVEGSRQDWQSHEVAAPLRALLAANLVSTDTLLGVIAAHEAEAEGFADVAAWRAAMLEGDGGIQRAWAQLLGLDAAGQEQAAAAGVAYRIGLLLRRLNEPAHARCLVMLSSLVETTPSTRTAVATPVIETLLLQEAAAVLHVFGDARRDRRGIAAFLPLVLARRDLRRSRPAAPGMRGFGDRMAVLVAGMRGRT